MNATITPKWPRSMKELRADPRVEEVSDERSSGNGVWAYLKYGWQSHLGTHQVTEDTLKDTLADFRLIEPCACAECLAHTKTAQEVR